MASRVQGQDRGQSSKPVCYCLSSVDRDVRIQALVTGNWEKVAATEVLR